MATEEEIIERTTIMQIALEDFQGIKSVNVTEPRAAAVVVFKDGRRIEGTEEAEQIRRRYAAMIEATNRIMVERFGSVFAR